jgi:hypothetical protein
MQIIQRAGAYEVHRPDAEIDSPNRNHSRMASETSTSVAINRTRVRGNTTAICGVMTDIMPIDEKARN